jgi:hypothetical protein
LETYSDFEEAVLNALKLVFPEAKVLGDVFHFKKNVNARVAMMNEADKSAIMKEIMRMAATENIEHFQTYYEQLTSTERVWFDQTAVDKFLLYFDKQWFRDEKYKLWARCFRSSGSLSGTTRNESFNSEVRNDILQHRNSFRKMEMAYYFLERWAADKMKKMCNPTQLSNHLDRLAAKQILPAHIRQQQEMQQAEVTLLLNNPQYAASVANDPSQTLPPPSVFSQSQQSQSQEPAEVSESTQATDGGCPVCGSRRSKGCKWLLCSPCCKHVIERCHGSTKHNTGKLTEQSEKALQLFELLQQAVEEKAQLRFTYFGKDHPGLRRNVQAKQLFVHEDGYALRADETFQGKTTAKTFLFKRFLLKDFELVVAMKTVEREDEDEEDVETVELQAAQQYLSRQSKRTRRVVESDEEPLVQEPLAQEPKRRRKQKTLHVDEVAEFEIEDLGASPFSSREAGREGESSDEYSTREFE